MVSNKKKRELSRQKCEIAKQVKEHHREVKKLVRDQKPKKESPINTKVSAKAKIIEDNKKTNEKDKEAERKRAAAMRILQKSDPSEQQEQIDEKVFKDSSRAFIGDIRKLIDEADVILMVLDARDPMGTRSLESEKLIKESNKTIIFVLNKIDLIPLDNMKQWVAYLNTEARTFPFKASCQEQAQRLGSSSGWKPTVDTNGSSAAFGINSLLDYLKSLNKSNKTTGTKSADKLVVGVAGVPNTGKSSLINSLKRKRICEAGNLAGLTRSLQHVALDNHVVLVDSPGIVLAKSTDAAEYALRNCLRVEKIADPVAVAEAIFRRCPSYQLMSIYKLNPFDNFDEFMLAFATRFGMLKKGGVLNLESAAIRIINDWNGGKIAYCSEPPVVQGLCDDNEMITGSVVVTDDADMVE